MHKYSALPASFVGKTGLFYVRQRLPDGSGYDPRVTVRESVEAYNNRTGTIDFCDVADAFADFSREVPIYLESLTTTPPPYPRDTDETDFGLTPARNFWHKRFRAEEGQKYV